ncbi:MAG: hypothetical protein NDI75_15045 [Candidatus Didemnitutus sp.]|nr:hypothetical protein [Candidatus Didemnitutus sp.]
MQPIELLAVVSDPHCGSTVGLMTPTYETLKGQTISQSPVQKWLWGCYQDAVGFVRDVKGESPLALVINGDCIEGIHHGTKEVISPEVGDHKQLAIDCLSPLAELATKRFMISGTECHTGASEISIATSLGCERNPDFPAPKDGKKDNDGAYIFDRLALDIKGVRLVARHHMPTSVRRNLSATQLSIQLGEEQLEAVNNGEPMPRVLLMAHRHRTGHFMDDNGMSVVTGAWQALTRHGHKVVSAARCKPSVFILDWRGKKTGELPHVHYRTYRAPSQSAIAL